MEESHTPQRLPGVHNCADLITLDLFVCCKLCGIHHNHVMQKHVGCYNGMKYPCNGVSKLWL